MFFGRDLAMVHGVPSLYMQEVQKRNAHRESNNKYRQSVSVALPHVCSLVTRTTHAWPHYCAVLLTAGAWAGNSQGIRRQGGCAAAVKPCAAPDH